MGKNLPTNMYGSVIFSKHGILRYGRCQGLRLPDHRDSCETVTTFSQYDVNALPED